MSGSGYFGLAILGRGAGWSGVPTMVVNDFFIGDGAVEDLGFRAPYRAIFVMRILRRLTGALLERYIILRELLSLPTAAPQT